MERVLADWIDSLFIGQLYRLQSTVVSSTHIRCKTKSPQICPSSGEIKDRISDQFLPWSGEQAGIKPVMITGDNPLTAQAVARELGLLKTGHVTTGAELEKMNEAEFEYRVKNIEIYARVFPTHKLRVVTLVT